ncbi:hypothetical protein IJD15_01220 [bacterium]|nr:hypothetical protein [bacterium]
MSYLSINTKELMAEKCRAQAAERRYFGNSVLAEVDRDMRLQSYNLKSDVYLSKDGMDDGKISFGEKLVNFGKGLVAPIKNIFSSPKNIAITALSALGAAALIVITGGAAAPVMVGAGIIGGGIQIAKGIQKQSNAVTDAQAAEAWKDMGSGTFTVGASVAGAKASLKAVGVNTQGMSAWKAAGKCLTDLPKYAKTAYKTGYANISKIIASIKKPTVHVNNDNVIYVESSEARPQLPSGKKAVTPELPAAQEIKQLPAGKEVKLLEAPKSTTPDVIELPPPSTPSPVIELPESMAGATPVETKVTPSAVNVTEIIGKDGKVIKIDTTPKPITEVIKDSYKAKLEAASAAQKSQKVAKPSLGSKVKDVFNTFGLFKPKNK